MKPALTEQDFADAAGQLGCEIAAIKAVCQVEAPRGGFNPDDTPVTLFEGHKFHKFTNGQFDIEAPDLSYPTWTRKHYGKTWQAEQNRLQRAMVLDREAALRSASWGKFQIMGFNHESVGFPSIQGFVNAMYAGEREHLMAFVMFVLKNGLAPSLRRKDWPAFARGYNGSGYAENKYDDKMAAAYAELKHG
jgi:hypothetical protein